MRDPSVHPGWKPGDPHFNPSPSTCPGCGEDAIQEVAKRLSWQPVTLRYDKDGQLEVDDYREFEWGDDVWVDFYTCRNCGEEWPSLSALAADQRLVTAFMDHIAYHDRMFDAAPPEDASACDRHQAASEAFTLALEILRGNGEA